MQSHMQAWGGSNPNDWRMDPCGKWHFIGRNAGNGAAAKNRSGRAMVATRPIIQRTHAALAALAACGGAVQTS